MGCRAAVRSHSLTGLIHENLHLPSNIVNLGIELIELWHNCLEQGHCGSAVAGAVAAAAAAAAAGPDDAEDAKPQGIEPARWGPVLGRPAEYAWVVHTLSGWCRCGRCRTGWGRSIS